jgi:hypothetical protein
MTIHEAVELLRESRKLLSHGCWGGKCCTLRREIDEALAEYEADMTEHRRRFGMEVKDLDRHLEATRMWKADKS